MRRRLTVSTSPVFLTTVGPFFDGFAARYGWTRGEASLAVALASLTPGLLTSVVGWAIDHVGVLRVMSLIGSAR